MDKRITRKENLQHWINEKYNGSISEYANDIDEPQGSISRFFMDSENKNSRKIGEIKARKLEIKSGMPEEWLDQDHNKETDHPTSVNEPQGRYNPTDAQLASLISVATPTYMKDLESIQKAQDAGVLEKSDKALLKIIAEKYKDRL